MEIHELFTWVDWTVVVVYLLLTTGIGHLMRGHQGSIRDFFLGGRSLPWPAVSGSIIATEISALTFIGVPAIVFSAGGDFRYIQWAIGSIIARFVVGFVFVRLYYERQIYSPYDYMGNKLGHHARLTTTLLFWVGAILGQSVRVMVTAIILQAITGLSPFVCIGVVGLFAVIWTWMGGMRTVIWTDVIQFFIFVLGGLVTLGVLIWSIPGGMGGIWEAAEAADKTRILDLRLDPTLAYTLWIGLFAMPIQNITAFGLDQLNAQRMFCCKGPGEARKAIIWSSVSQLITVMMLLIGAGLFAWYQLTPLTPQAQDLVDKDMNTIFPIWIITNLPMGVSGLILAGAFAAAISSLDSVLAALAQTTMTLITPSMRKEDSASEDDGHDAATGAAMVLRSRLLVLGWGAALTLFTMALYSFAKNSDLVQLAFGMLAYTYGPLLGVFVLAAMRRRVPPAGLYTGVALSVLFTIFVQPHIYNVIPALAEFRFEAFGNVYGLQPKIHWAWMYPFACLLTILTGWFWPGGGRREPENSGNNAT